MQRLERITQKIESYVDKYDYEAFDDLRGLILRVQQSMDDGVIVAENLGHRTMSMKTSVKQAESMWQRHQESESHPQLHKSEMVRLSINRVR